MGNTVNQKKEIYWINAGIASFTMGRVLSR